MAGFAPRVKPATARLPQVRRADPGARQLPGRAPPPALARRRGR